jgi:hypothetical protein
MNLALRIQSILLLGVIRFDMKAIKGGEQRSRCLGNPVCLINVDNVGPVKTIEFCRGSNAIGPDILSVQVISDF